MRPATSVLEKSVEELQRSELVINNGLERTLNVIEDLNYIHSDDVDALESKLTEIKDLVKQFICIDEERIMCVEAVEEMRNERRNDAMNDENLSDILNVKRTVIKDRGHPSMEDHEKYREMLQLIDELKKSTGTSDSDSLQPVVDPEGDLAVFQESVNTLDPITKQQIVNPVRSKSCKHSYDKTTIANHLKGRNGRVRCPIPGCGHFLTLNDLEVDFKLKKYLETK